MISLYLSASRVCAITSVAIVDASIAVVAVTSAYKGAMRMAIAAIALRTRMLTDI
jgi:hypothetical protein